MQPTDSKTSTAPEATTPESARQTITIPPNKKKSKPSSKTRRRLKPSRCLFDGWSIIDGRGVVIYGNGYGVMSIGDGSPRQLCLTR